MKINVLKNVPKKLEEFSHNEWKKYNTKHYGLDAVWESGKYSIVAKEEEKVIGLIQFVHDGGVIYLDNLIIVEEFQGKGVGKKLMLKLEKMAKKLNCHKIFLYTGKGWEAPKFYEKLGYKKTANLPNHFMHKDFYEYTKFLD